MTWVREFRLKGREPRLDHVPHTSTLAPTQMMNITHRSYRYERHDMVKPYATRYMVGIHRTARIGASSRADQRAV